MSADMDLPGVAVAANGLIYIIANGDRGATTINRGGGPGPGGPGAPGAAAPGAQAGGRGAGPGAGRGGAAVADAEDSGAPVQAPNGRGAAAAAGGGRGGGAGRGAAAPAGPIIPGYDADARWLADQRRPFDQGGQQGGSRFSGGNDSLNAVLQVLDPATGNVLYSSGNMIDSWNHYGGIALSDGRIYMSSYDARVYAIGVPGAK
jgi:hypothetical protein